MVDGQSTYEDRVDEGAMNEWDCERECDASQCRKNIKWGATTTWIVSVLGVRILVGSFAACYFARGHGETKKVELLETTYREELVELRG